MGSDDDAVTMFAQDADGYGEEDAVGISSEDEFDVEVCVEPASTWGKESAGIAALDTAIGDSSITLADQEAKPPTGTRFTRECMEPWVCCCIQVSKTVSSSRQERPVRFACQPGLLS
jgi:hypothetical protein